MANPIPIAAPAAPPDPAADLLDRCRNRAKRHGLVLRQFFTSWEVIRNTDRVMLGFSKDLESLPALLDRLIPATAILLSPVGKLRQERKQATIEARRASARRSQSRSISAKK